MKNIWRQIPVHKISLTKVLLVVAAGALFFAATQTIIATQETKARQSHQAQQAVFNHTETLNDIDRAVTELKMNNQTNHDTTIRYLQCLSNLVLEDSQGIVITQVDLNNCTSVSGLLTTSTDSGTQTNTSAGDNQTVASPPASSGATGTTSGGGQGSTSSPPVTKSAAAPAHPLVCTLTLGLLGCKHN